MAEEDVMAAPFFRKPQFEQIGRGEAEQQRIGVKSEVEHMVAQEKIAENRIAEP